MSRGLLDTQTLNDIHTRVRPLGDLRSRALALAPDFLAPKFDPMSLVPVAAVCFHDCTEMVAQSRYALFEHFAHREYYRESETNGSAITATFFEKYYLDDAALRLYAGAEHLANAVVFMLNLSDDALLPYQEKYTSQHTKVGMFLKRERADWMLTRTFVELVARPEWQFTMTYRNRWVHEQPPTIGGLGIQYRRVRPWKVSSDGSKKFLAFGAGDPPEFDIATVTLNVRVAHELFHAAVDKALDEYYAILAANGVEYRDGKISMRLFE